MRHKCLNCQRDLDTCDRADNPGARAQMKWCSAACKQHYKNRAYYALHRDEVRARIAANKRASQRAAQSTTVGPTTLKNDAGFIYVVRCDRYYKIGCTRNAKQRIARFETSYPHALTVVNIARVNDMTQVEQSLHTRFCAKRVKGEWFDLTASDLRVIARMLPKEQMPA